MDKAERVLRMNDPRYPLSAKYDPQWIIDNQMGSHCLWLTEAITREMELRPGIRILDLGCGKALSSVFLAKEFGAEVWAFDLRVPAGDNLQRVREAGVEKRVFPLQGDALQMPFADDFFDAVVSINAIWKFGTGEDFADKHLARVVKPGGQIGIVIPGMREELTRPPEHLLPYWHPDFDAYHAPAWWRGLWERANTIELQLVDAFEGREGSRLWRDFAWILDPKDAEIMDVDDGRNITFLRMLASKKETSA